jgi:hypothetical protein
VEYVLLNTSQAPLQAVFLETGGADKIVFWNAVGKAGALLFEVLQKKEAK